MQELTKNVFRVPLIIWGIIFLIMVELSIKSVYGGTFYGGLIEPSTENILITILASLIHSFIYFLIALIISFIYYKIKKKK